MKKYILILLLFTGYLQAQTYPVNPTKFGKISLNTNTVSTSTTKINTQESDGQINYIDAVNLPVPTSVINAIKQKADLSTGLLKNGLISINADPTKFNISAGIGIISNFDDPENPVSTIISFPAFTGVTPTYLLTGNITYIAINSTPAVVMQATPFTDIQRRDLIILGAAIHSNLTNINVVNNISAPSNAIGNQLHDFMEAVGALNITGNKYSANGANLSLNKSAGTIFKFGVNFATNWKDPHVLSQSSGTALTFRYRTQNGTEGSDVTVINPAVYDLNNVLTSVPNNKFSIQTVTMFQTGLTRIQYGQNVYDDLASAQAAIFTRDYNVEANIKENGITRAYIIVKNNATSLQNATDSRIIEAQKFGGVASGGVALTFANIVSALGYTPANDTNVIHTTLNETKAGVLTTYGSNITDLTYNYSLSLQPIRNQFAAFFNQPFYAADQGYYVFRPSGTNIPSRFYIMPNGTPTGTTSKFEMFNTDYSADYTTYQGFNILMNNSTNIINIGSNRGVSGGARQKLIIGGDYAGSVLQSNVSQLHFNTDNTVNLNPFGGAFSVGTSTTDPFGISLDHQVTFKNPVATQPMRLNIVGNGWAAGVYLGRDAIRTASWATQATTSDVEFSTNPTNSGTGLTANMRIWAATGNIGIQNGGTFTDNGLGILQVTGNVYGSVAASNNNHFTRLGEVNTALGLKANSASPTLTGTPLAPTATPGTNNTQIATTAFVQTATRPYKSYTGIFNQSGTSAPTVATIFENTIGAIVWTRTGVGTYVGTLTGAFTSGKTIGFLTNTSVTGSAPINFKISSSSANTIDVVSYINGAASDNAAGSMSLEIRVYL